jgi:hypothetical protein
MALTIYEAEELPRLPREDPSQEAENVRRVHAIPTERKERRAISTAVFEKLAILLMILGSGEVGEDN